MESATWCRTPAAASAARRLRPEVSKNSSTALSSNESRSDPPTIERPGHLRGYTGNEVALRWRRIKTRAPSKTVAADMQPIKNEKIRTDTWKKHSAPAFERITSQKYLKFSDQAV